MNVNAPAALTNSPSELERRHRLQTAVLEIARQGRFGESLRLEGGKIADVLDAHRSLWTAMTIHFANNVDPDHDRVAGLWAGTTIFSLMYIGVQDGQEAELYKLLQTIGGDVSQ